MTDQEREERRVRTMRQDELTVESFHWVRLHGGPHAGMFIRVHERRHFVGVIFAKPVVPASASHPTVSPLPTEYRRDPQRPLCFEFPQDEDRFSDARLAFLSVMEFLCWRSRRKAA